MEPYFRKENVRSIRPFNDPSVGILMQANQEKRKVSVFTRSYVYQGFVVSIENQRVKSKRSEYFYTEQTVLEMVNVISVPRSEQWPDEPDGNPTM